MVASLQRRLILLLLLVWAAPARAWLEDPHRLVGKLAMLDLPPALKAWVDATMLGHPDPQFRRFDEGCVWPDWIKSNPRQGWEHTAGWHYINVFFSPDGTPLPAIPEINGMWAARHVEDELRAHHQEAQYLCWLGHLVGDLHQPLHCCTRVTAAQPEGDRGGNATPLPGGPPKMNLHLWWDSVAGDYLQPTTPERLDQIAAELRSRYPRSVFAEELKRPDWQQWGNESFDLAVEVAYPMMGQPGYPELTREICLRRIALAGYRLADRLQALHP